MSKKIDPFFNENDIITDPYVHTSYKIHKLLGAGAFAQCFLVSIADTSDMYALKIISLSSLKTQKVKDKLESEIQIHSMLNDPSIVQMYRSFRDKSYAYLVLEYCSNGGLDILLKKVKSFNECKVRKLAKQILNGLTYIHSMNVVHRDLKLGNLFLDSSNALKLGDFGLSALIENGRKKNTICGTPNYIAPEILFDDEHSFEVDIWSLGVIIYTLYFGTPPFQKSNVKEIYQLIKTGSFIFPEDKECSKELRNLINGLLCTDPLARLPLNDICTHKFFKEQLSKIERTRMNLQNNTYVITDEIRDYITFSIPISKIRGIGYLLSSGTIGIFYNDHSNFLQIKDTIVYITEHVDKGKKVLQKEEYSIKEIPEKLRERYEHIQYFIKNFMCNLSGREVKYTFMLRVKKLREGMLYGLFNNVIVFDFINGNKVVLDEYGKKVYCFNGKRESIEFEGELKGKCLDILRDIQ